jgi:hypothetical protein
MSGRPEADEAWSPRGDRRSLATGLVGYLKH